MKKETTEENSVDVVGRAKNDKTYRIYAITNYNEKGAVGLLKNNPSSPVGNWIKDGSFDNSIRDNSENVNTSDEKTLKKSSRKSLDVDSEGRGLTKEHPDLVSYLRNFLHRLNIYKYEYMNI